jgi:hypothetical protein
MKINKLLFILFAIYSCSSNDKKNEVAGNFHSVHIANQISSPPSQAFDIKTLEVKTFEVKDSLGKAKGWGYNIYVNNSIALHQPIIPAIEGSKSFKTEQDAFKTGTYAAYKIKTTGSLSALSIEELDSLGINGNYYDNAKKIIIQ